MAGDGRLRHRTHVEPKFVLPPPTPRPPIPRRLRTRPGPSCYNSLQRAGAVGSAEGFLTGEPEKGLRVWAQPGQQSRMTVHAPETNAQALRSLYTRPGPGRPGPGSRRGRRGCRVLAARPPALPQPAPLAARQGFKGCAEHAGAPGWNGLLKPRRENKGRPLRAGAREPVAGRGSQEKEGWVGTARCSQLPAPSRRSQAWPLHEEEPEARGRPCFGRWGGGGSTGQPCVSLKNPEESVRRPCISENSCRHVFTRLT